MSGHEITPENLKKSKGETVSYQNPERDAELVIEKGANFLEIIRVSPPADVILLFRQKDLKTCWPWRGPSGPLCGSPTPAVAQTRGACPESY